jgi:hypothetical protein
MPFWRLTPLFESLLPCSIPGLSRSRVQRDPRIRFMSYPASSTELHPDATEKQAYEVFHRRSWLDTKVLRTARFILFMRSCGGNRWTPPNGKNPMRLNLSRADLAAVSNRPTARYPASFSSVKGQTANCPLTAWVRKLKCGHGCFRTITRHAKCTHRGVRALHALAGLLC